MIKATSTSQIKGIHTMLKERKERHKVAQSKCLNYTIDSILYRLIAINANTYRRFIPLYMI